VIDGTPSPAFFSQRGLLAAMSVAYGARDAARLVCAPQPLSR